MCVCVCVCYMCVLYVCVMCVCMCLCVGNKTTHTQDNLYLRELIPRSETACTYKFRQLIHPHSLFLCCEFEHQLTYLHFFSHQINTLVTATWHLLRYLLQLTCIASLGFISGTSCLEFFVTISCVALHLSRNSMLLSFIKILNPDFGWNPDKATSWVML